MRENPDKKAGSCANSPGLHDAKASGPAPSGTALAVQAQMEIAHPFPIQSVHLQSPTAITTRKGANGCAARDGRSAVVLDEELRSGKYGTIRWDEFRGAKLLYVGGKPRDIDDDVIQGLIIQLDRAGVRNINRASFVRALDHVAKSQKFNSLQEWLDLLPAWDGIPRVEQFFKSYFNVAVGAYEMAVARYLWTALVARILQPGCQAGMVPVLVGRRGSLKSSALQIIAPSVSSWTDVKVTEKEEKVFKKVRGRYLIECQDLRGMKGRADADDFKAFISNRFLERESNHTEGTDRLERSLVLVGTTSRHDFARDPDGNRHLLPVCVREANLSLLEADKFQLWAEALATVSGRLTLGLPPVDYEEAEKLAEDVLIKFEPEGLWTNDPDLLRFFSGNPDKFHTDDALRAVSHKLTGTGRLYLDRREMGRSLRQNGYESKSAQIPGQTSRPNRWRLAKPKGTLQLMPPAKR